ncbi:MAG TPA: HlyD family efflux transporter periplasmic adaptor subunit [Anaerolineae bacterium]
MRRVRAQVLSFLIFPLSTALAACGGSPTPAVKATVVPFSAAVVTAKGSVIPNRYARLAFNVGGTVASVNVKEGASVQAGDIIAALDTRDLDWQVKTAQDSLDVAKTALLQVQAPAGAEEITIVTAAYDSALAQLARAQRGPTSEELDILRANLAKAQAALGVAQAAYDRAGGEANPFIGSTASALQLQAATLDYKIAQANFDKAVKPDPTVVQQAQSAVDQAQAQLELKKRGPRAEDIALAQGRVKQAQTGVEQAQASLAKSKLVAPFAGVITNLNLREGETVQAGSGVATLADLTLLHVDTTDLDEFGAARIQVGQVVRITVNAFADKTLNGKVTAISRQAVTLSTGDISYVAQIALDKQDPELRWGMTVKVIFSN